MSGERVRQLVPLTRRLATGGVTAILLLLTAAFAGVGLAGSPSTRVSHSVDTRLCPFPLEITVKTEGQIDPAPPRLFGSSSTARARSRSATRRPVARRASTRRARPPSIRRPGSVTFRGHQVWLWSVGKRVPFMSTDGEGSLEAPAFVLHAANARARVIDPCALVAASPPSTQPRTTPAPWGPPASTLSQIGRAGLIPVIGRVIRHDHVHLDVIVNGRHVTVPGVVGLVEPLDVRAVSHGAAASGDCATGHGFFAQVANSPLHTHSPSGIIHIESDRPGTFTLGQFFDEWGVRLDSTLRRRPLHRQAARSSGSSSRASVRPATPGGSCSETAGRSRSSSAARTTSAPSRPRTAGGWPGGGCGGAGETSCLP